jgi:hypothetical protein
MLPAYLGVDVVSPINTRRLDIPLPCFVYKAADPRSSIDHPLRTHTIAPTTSDEYLTNRLLNMKSTHLTRLLFGIGLLVCASIVLGLSADIEAIVSAPLARSHLLRLHPTTKDKSLIPNSHAPRRSAMTAEQSSQPRPFPTQPGWAGSPSFSN